LLSAVCGLNAKAAGRTINTAPAHCEDLSIERLLSHVGRAAPATRVGDARSGASG
jgi:hypothetical protein